MENKRSDLRFWPELFRKDLTTDPFQGAKQKSVPKFEHFPGFSSSQERLSGRFMAPESDVLCWAGSKKITYLISASLFGVILFPWFVFLMVVSMVSVTCHKNIWLMSEKANFLKTIRSGSAGTAVLLRLWPAGGSKQQRTKETKNLNKNIWKQQETTTWLKSLMTAVKSADGWRRISWIWEKSHETFRLSSGSASKSHKTVELDSTARIPSNVSKNTKTLKKPKRLSLFQMFQSSADTGAFRRSVLRLVTHSDARNGTKTTETPLREDRISSVNRV